MPRGLVAFALAASLLACKEAPGGLRALQHYTVDLEVTDSPDAYTALFERSLDFEFLGDHPDSPSRCGSLAGATVRFAGMPVPVDHPGGWTEFRLPTNTAPGETINADFCERPSLKIDLHEPKPQEAQNGTLEIDGEGRHLAVPINHPFGAPQVALVTASAQVVVLHLEGFAARPTLEAIKATFRPTVTGTPTVEVQKTSLSEDGLLELSLPPSAIHNGALAGTLGLVVDLGAESLPCVGFARCNAHYRVNRDVFLDLPAP